MKRYAIGAALGAVLCLIAAFAAPVGNYNVINVLNYGAVGDCSTDDSTAIQDAINAAYDGGEIYLPTTPAGCYFVNGATQLTIPSTVSVWIHGNGPGNANAADPYGGTVIQAGSSVTGSVFVTCSNCYTTWGVKLSDMTIEGNQNPQYILNLACADGMFLENLALLDATSAEVILGNGGTCNTEGNMFSNVVMNNPLSASVSAMPANNIVLDDTTDDHFFNTIAINAKTTNFKETVSVGNGGNYQYGTHTYDYTSSAQVPTAYGIEMGGSGGHCDGCQIDGAGTADILMDGIGGIVINSLVQFDSVTPKDGVDMTGTGNMAVGVQCINVASDADCMILGGTNNHATSTQNSTGTYASTGAL